MKIFFLTTLILMSCVVIFSAFQDVTTKIKPDYFTGYFSIGVGVFVIIFCAVVLRRELKGMKFPFLQPKS